MNPSIHGSTTEQKVLQGTSIRSLQLHSAYAYACEACPPDWVDDKCLTEMGGRHHSLTNLIRWFQPHNWIGALLLSQVTLDRCLPGPKRNIGSYVYLSPRYPQKKKRSGDSIHTRINTRPATSVDSTARWSSRRSRIWFSGKNSYVVHNHASISLPLQDFGWILYAKQWTVNAYNSVCQHQ
jgi:hypothetical protein